VNIHLRNVEPHDAKFIAQWFSDEEIAKYMSTVVRNRKHTPESVMYDILNSDSTYERLFMVYADNEKYPIGHAGIDDIDTYDRRGEIFFLIGNKDYLGKGIGKLIVKELQEYGFRILRLHSLFATAAVENYASVKILESCGFTRIGIRRGYNRVGSRYMDEVLFDMLGEDYLR
jgi:diamine N-acetyltransferase